MERTRMKTTRNTSIISCLAITLGATMTATTSATTEDAMDVFGLLEGSFGDLSRDDIADVVAGEYHALLLTRDGFVRAAGWNGPYDLDTGAACGQCDPPASLSGVQALAAGTRHSLALLDDGSIACWGCDDGGCDVPEDLVPGNGTPEDPAVAIAAGDGFSLALLESGVIRCWGSSDREWVCLSIPPEAQDPGNPVARLLAYRDVCVAILQDNTFVRWGGEMFGPLDGLPDGAVIADACLSPVRSQFDFETRPSLAFLLEDGRYVDGGGIVTFDEANPCVGISPGPATVLRMADGSWSFRYSVTSEVLVLPGDMGFPDPPVSIVSGGRDYLITVPLPADCDDNGIADHVEIAEDPNLDCDGDGRLDACRADSHWFEAGAIASEGVDLDLGDLPFSEAPVIASVEATGDLEAADEFLRFDWNGDTFATAFGKNGAPVACEPGSDTFTIAPRIWNDTDGNDDRILTVSPSVSVDPAACEDSNFAITFAIQATAPYHDCNDNGIDDDCEIADGLALDVDGDRNPDECQPDCDRDGRPDAWTIFEGLVPDCNVNGVPDSCDILAGRVLDENGNGIPDECETDCNGNGIPDDIDLEDGTSDDVDGNAIPDECQPDCNANGLPDLWEIENGLADDCDDDLVIDECAVADGSVIDCNANGIPDSCEKGRPGDQGNGDLDGDGCVGPTDLGILLSLWGSSNPLCGDLDGDGEVAGSDLGILFVNWGCP